MGRLKIKKELQKKTVTIRLPKELMDYVNEFKNKSRFIEGLLNEYFKKTK